MTKVPRIMARFVRPTPTWQLKSRAGSRREASWPWDKLELSWKQSRNNTRKVKRKRVEIRKPLSFMISFKTTETGREGTSGELKYAGNSEWCQACQNERVSDSVKKDSCPISYWRKKQPLFNLREPNRRLQARPKKDKTREEVHPVWVKSRTETRQSGWPKSGHEVRTIHLRTITPLSDWLLELDWIKKRQHMDLKSSAVTFSPPQWEHPGTLLMFQPLITLKAHQNKSPSRKVAVLLWFMTLQSLTLRMLTNASKSSSSGAPSVGSGNL